MSGSSALGASGAGAGRTVHVFFPDFVQITGNMPNSGGGRAGTAQGGAIVSTGTQGAPPAQLTGDYRGRRCWQISSAVGGAGVAAWFTHRWYVMQDAVKFPPGLDDI